MSNHGKSERKPDIARAAAVDLQHLRFAVTAADSGSLRRAADLLCVRHSALSRSISQLERHIGASLFERSTAGVKATLAGRSVLRIARTILDQVETLIATGSANGRGEAGHISIGLCTSISAGNLRATLLEFRKRFPQVELTAVQGQRTHLMNELRSGTLDVLVITGEARSSGNKSVKLWSERILLSLPEHHPLAARDVIYWTDLRDETLLLSHHDPGRDLEKLIFSKLLTSDDRPRIDRHDANQGIIKSLISIGLGISLSMESDLGASFAGVVYRELRDGTGASRIDFSAHWRRDSENPVLNQFLKLLGERYPLPASGD
ncbi:LysR family transcriptional regulator [Bradyrhizobium sp. CCGUVB14]|uniref:LysR substrate-binding domain-containing protein n=1 Tax=Bradyrhizobium sp. CCGUVB14 TaxID=2949628 RepID=UPI0020B1E247|nr:LysR family transcriptional regulator [Bradyrhizobium sp. CCGUVB14]MCP3445751.1 LysR family transcriptional regulator [Bradyrhizobium sp. CCGUVB14]